MTSPKINNETYINRELSWIDFNKRVLELAIEEETPLLEKIKFSSIFNYHFNILIIYQSRRLLFAW